MKLWSGRIPGSMDPTAAQLNNSLSFDKRLAQVDVSGSIAWAKALLKVKILDESEAVLLLKGLKAIQEEFTNHKFVFDPNDEDIHTAVERRLTELVGPVAGKLHTGRSRNDQVTTDFRLWLHRKGGRYSGKLASTANYPGRSGRKGFRNCLTGLHSFPTGPTYPVQPLVAFAFLASAT